MSSPVGWLGRGGGQPAVGAAAQPPAALMDGPVMGPAPQGQIGQVGGAAIQPMLEVVGVAPGKGPVAGGKDTALVTHGQGGVLGRWMTRLARPTSNGWVGAPPRVGGNRAVACASWCWIPASACGSGIVGRSPTPRSGLR